MKALIGTCDPPQVTPMTEPWTLPHDGGGATFIVTSTGVTAYGVSVRTPICAVYLPGWMTPAAPVAVNVTVTRCVAPGARVNVAGDSESHGTSVTLSHSASPPRVSELTVGVKPPDEPPILKTPHAPAER